MYIDNNVEVPLVNDKLVKLPRDDIKITNENVIKINNMESGYSPLNIYLNCFGTHQVLKDPKNSRQRLLIPKTLGLTSLVVTFSLRTDLRAQQCLYVGTDVLIGRSVTWKTLITVRRRHHQIRHPFLMRHWTQLLVHLCQYCRMFRPW